MEQHLGQRVKVHLELLDRYALLETGKYTRRQLLPGLGCCSVFDIFREGLERLIGRFGPVHRDGLRALEERGL